MNDGARRLQQLGVSLSEISAAAGRVSKTSAIRWRRGEKTPGTEARSLLLAAFGIPLNAWDLQSESDEPSLPLSALPTEPTDLSAADGDELAELIQRLRSARNRDDISPLTLARLASAETIVRREQEARRSMLDRIKASAEWQRILSAFELALTPFPAARDALVASLKELL